MRRILILGAGTAGTATANRLGRRLRAALRRGEVQLTIVDPDPVHVYRPGQVSLPFGDTFRERLVRARASTIDADVRHLRASIASIDPDGDTVRLTTGEWLPYDHCIIATGSRLVPEETVGMLGPGWRASVHEFYTLDGAEALAYALDRFVGGRLVIHVAGTPIRSPAAPLEFAFLADAYFTACGIRDHVEIVLTTPPDSASAVPTGVRALGDLLERKGIRYEPEFTTARIEAEPPAWARPHSGVNGTHGPSGGMLVAADGRRIPFDLLVTVPLHRGAAFVGASPGLGDARDFVRVHPRTLQGERKENLWALGDAANCPTAKVGTAAHFQSTVLSENVVRALRGLPPAAAFDGHAHCLVETGHGKAVVLDFNYETEPLPGRFPFAWGPAPLLKESRLGHLGTLALRRAYWTTLLPGLDLPGVPARMKIAGKRRPLR